MLRWGVELVSWLVGWFLFFLVMEGETPLDMEAKLKGALGWEVSCFDQSGDFSLVVQTQIQEELFSSYKFLEMKKLIQAEGSRWC